MRKILKINSFVDYFSFSLYFFTIVFSDKGKTIFLCYFTLFAVHKVFENEIQHWRNW